MSKELITKARALSADATPGPWVYKAGDVLTVQGEVIAQDLYRGIPSLRDGRFIAESRTLLPLLADLAESEGRRADAAEANAQAQREIAELATASLAKRTQELAAAEEALRVLTAGIQAYRTGSCTLAQFWENENGKAVPR